MTRILVVEDDDATAFALRIDLTAEGYAVEEARDGEIALKLALGSSFDLILLDIGLPKKDGYTVCKELRRDGNRTPILMLTANTSDADKVRGLELEADEYVVKPYSPRVLLAQVRALLRRAGAEIPEIYRFGDVEVDFKRAELRRNGHPIKTTPLEFKLLSTFIRNRGRVLTRDRLIDEVWALANGPTDSAINTHIMNLRRKVEPDPHKPIYLAGVLGLGYRFDG